METKIVNNESILAYIEAMLDLLTLLNEDGFHGREFFLNKIDIENQKREDTISNYISGDYAISLIPVTDFKAELEQVYISFCQKQEKESIKQLFYVTLTDFVKDANELLEIKIEGNYLDGLPYKGFLIVKKETSYFLHFGINT